MTVNFLLWWGYIWRSLVCSDYRFTAITHRSILTGRYSIRNNPSQINQIPDLNSLDVVDMLLNYFLM